jgi:hypothetical protein
LKDDGYLLKILGNPSDTLPQITFTYFEQASSMVFMGTEEPVIESDSISGFMLVNSVTTTVADKKATQKQYEHLSRDLKLIKTCFKKYGQDFEVSLYSQESTIKSAERVYEKFLKSLIVTNP